MEMKINIEIGLTQKLSHQIDRALDALTKEYGFGLNRKNKTQATAAELLSHIGAPAEDFEVVEVTPAPTQAKQELTTADVRSAMDRTRKRIEGEDWETNQDGEGYKKWHRALTSWFKTTAAECGADKPSALPDTTSRASFIEQCDALSIINGELSIALPF